MHVIRKSVAVCATVAALCLQVGCGNKAPKATPAKLIDVAEVVQPASVRWRADVGDSTERDAVELSPYVTEDKIFTVDAGGTITALDPLTGAVDWSSDLNADITAGISGDDDNLYVASANGDVFAVSLVHGGTLWTSSVSSEVIAAPVAGDDYVVVRSIDGKVYALEKTSGERRWIYTYIVPALSIHGNGRPLVVSDGILVGLDNGRLVALRASDGRVFWEVELGLTGGGSEIDNLNDLDADIQILEPFIYAVNYQGNLVQVDPREGRTSWSSSVSSVAGLAVTPSQVFVTDEFDRIKAFRRDTGELLWEQSELTNRRLTAPVVYQSGTVIVGDFDGFLHILSVEDGSIVGRLKTGLGEITGRPVVQDDSVFVQGRDGKVVAVQL